MILRRLSVAALALAVAAGSIADRPPSRPPLTLGGYRVLEADFHAHSSTWSDGACTPFGLVLEAERQNLDVLAITGHNEVLDARVGRWFSERIGGPTVLVGQEILAPGHHIIGLDTDEVVDSRLTTADQIREIHRQGGIAIAAHPVPAFWAGFEGEAMQLLDGAEICHPLIYAHRDAAAALEAFSAGRSWAMIGSSDFHGTGRLGQCRTVVFARDASSTAVLEALRAKRTVVYGLDGKAYGDPELIALAAAHPELRERATTDARPGWLDWISRVFGVAGLLGLSAPWSAARRRREAADDDAASAPVGAARP